MSEQERETVPRPAPDSGGTQSPQGPPAPAAPSEPPLVVRVLHALSFRNISAIYIFIALFLIFSLWVPDTFLQGTTWRALLDNEALTAILAVGLVIPLSAGVF